MATLRGLDESRHSCFVVATSTAPTGGRPARGNRDTRSRRYWKLDFKLETGLSAYKRAPGCAATCSAAGCWWSLPWDRSTRCKRSIGPIKDNVGGAMISAGQQALRTWRVPAGPRKAGASLQNQSGSRPDHLTSRGRHPRLEGTSAFIPWVAKDPPERQVSRGAAGGAADEAGSGFRAGVAAFIAAHILLGEPFVGLGLPPASAVPTTLQLETEAAVDDINVSLLDGMLFLQAKTRIEWSDTSMNAVVAQWVRLVRDRGLDPQRDRLIAVGASTSGPVDDLRKALRRRSEKISGPPTKAESDALRKLGRLLSELSDTERERVLDCAGVWILDLENVDGAAAQIGRALLEPAVVPRGSGLVAWSVLKQKAHDLARQRLGTTIDGLIGVLREANLEPISDREGYAAARRLSRSAKVDS